MARKEMSDSLTNCKQSVKNSHQLAADCHRLTQGDLGVLCVCAERYALGRRTYMPSLVCGIIQSLVSEISDKDIYILTNDIENPFGGYGDDCDKVEWMKLLEVLKEEQEWRTTNNDKR